MTSIERRNYKVAVIYSLVFHALLILVINPGIIPQKSEEIEAIGVGLFELPSSGPAEQESGGKVETPRETVKEPPPAAQKETVPEKPLISKNVPEKARLKIPDEQPKHTAPDPSASRGDDPDGSNHTGEGTDSSVKAPVSLGSGEGMVANRGSLPSYPKNAMNEGVEGQVEIQILVSAAGQLEQVILVKSSGDPRLDKVAVNSPPRQWGFKPGNDKYFINLVFSFEIKSGVSAQFIKAETRP